VESYSTTAALDKHSLAAFAPTTRVSLKDRLAHTREANGRHKTGAGARRRAAYEHQLDDHCEILRACETPGVVIAISRNARVKTSDAPRLAARARAAVLRTQGLEPRALLQEHQAQPRSGVDAVRWEIEWRLAWARENHPARAGWALKQSAPRAARHEGATAFYLPRRSWSAFTLWRRVVREIARLLLRLHEKLSRVIPLRRGLAPRAKPEESSHVAVAEKRAVATLGDQLSWLDVAARVEARHFSGM
jgi:hypothetical protein